MNSTLESERDTVVCSRIFKASVERVFAAWTDPALLSTWFGPQGVASTRAAVDLVVGGRYDLYMTTSAGDEIHRYGVYREIVANQKLVFTWVLEGQVCAGSVEAVVETVVSIEFRAHESGTEVALTHRGLPTAASREAHQSGWEGCLQCLQQMLVLAKNEG